jgi:hypothetical protein
VEGIKVVPVAGEAGGQFAEAISGQQEAVVAEARGRAQFLAEARLVWQVCSAARLAAIARGGGRPPQAGCRREKPLWRHSPPFLPQATEGMLPHHGRCSTLSSLIPYFVQKSPKRQ